MFDVYLAETIGENLKELRGKQPLKSVSMCTGISTGLLKRYENGKTIPSSQVLYDLADFFNTSTDHILGRVDKRTLLYRDRKGEIKMVDGVERLSNKYGKMNLINLVADMMSFYEMEESLNFLYELLEV